MRGPCRPRCFYVSTFSSSPWFQQMLTTTKMFEINKKETLLKICKRHLLVHPQQHSILNPGLCTFLSFNRDSEFYGLRDLHAFYSCLGHSVIPIMWYFFVLLCNNQLKIYLCIYICTHFVKDFELWIIFWRTYTASCFFLRMQNFL